MKHSNPSASKVKRDSALARPELRRQTPYIDADDRLPDIGKPVIGYANDGRGDYRLPFHIVYRQCGWCNVKHERPLQVKIVGWLHA